MKNKRGNMLASVMIAIMLFMIGMIVVNFIKPEVLTARTGLNCATGTSISDGTKLMCLGVDIVVPYFIILVFSIAGGILFEKLLI